MGTTRRLSRFDLLNRSCSTTVLAAGGRIIRPCRVSRAPSLSVLATHLRSSVFPGFETISGKFKKECANPARTSHDTYEGQTFPPICLSVSLSETQRTWAELIFFPPIGLVAHGRGKPNSKENYHVTKLHPFVVRSL